MTPAAFRKLALSMPHAVERDHMSHPDFRVNNKVFATLFDRDGVTWAMVKLNPVQQRQVIEANPKVFQPVPGGWGRGGATQVTLREARTAAVRGALIRAWLNVAPKKLIEESGTIEPD